MNSRIAQGIANRAVILDFLATHYRWYSIYELADTLDICYQSISYHCQNSTDLGILEETVFYKHNRNRRVSRLHYRYRR